MEKAKMLKYLGTDKHGCDYILFSDNYVYQFKGTRCLGWLCSAPAWERTLHNLTI